MIPQNNLITLPRIEDLTRREFMFSALGGALLIACGDDEDDADPTATPAIEPTTRRVETPLGAVDVPFRPQRVVCLGEDFMLADLLDLGVKPVASTAAFGDHFTGVDSFDVAGIQPMSSMELDLEALVTLQPDMMVIYSLVAENIGIEVLHQIAPTVAVSTEDYRLSYTSLAAAFGIEERARARLAEYDASAKEAGQALDAANRTMSVVSVYPGASIAVWVGGPSDLPQAVIDMGFTLKPDAVQLPPTGSLSRAYISLEQVEILDGESIVMSQSSAIEGEDAALAEVTSSATWQSLPAVAAGRVHTFDRFAHPGVPGRIALLQELKKALAL